MKNVKIGFYVAIVIFIFGIFMATEPVYAHTKCKVKLPFGNWTEGCPHSHSRIRAPENNTTYSQGWGMENGQSSNRQQKQPVQRKNIIICNRTTTYYDLQYILDGSRYKVTQSACNQHQARSNGHQISFYNPAQVKRYNLNYFNHKKYNFTQLNGGYFDLYHER